MMVPGLEHWAWSIHGWAMGIGVLCAVACAIPGNFLVLRRMSMMGDAISHAVLPGLAVAFLLTGERTSLPMFAGAAAVGVLTAVFTEWVRGTGKVDEAASMGVVFTTLFAIGLVIIVWAADKVDLDAKCVLFGSPETAVANKYRVDIFGLGVPGVAVSLAVVLAMNLCFVIVLYKELKVTSFDPAMATSMGINSTLMHYGLMTVVAITAVASFEAVGNILVVAVLIVPPAAAYMLTDRLWVMIAVSMVIAAVAGVLGVLGALVLPAMAGYGSVSSAGMIAVAAGVLFTLAVLLGPRHGIISRVAHQARLSLRIAGEDVLAMLYRVEELAQRDAAAVLPDHLSEAMHMTTLRRRMLVGSLVRGGMVRRDGGRLSLTDPGRDRARDLVRSHRLWETYLHRYAALRPDHLHLSAERLEHATSGRLQAHLDARTNSPRTDPHGTAIPPPPAPGEPGRTVSRPPI